MALVPLIVSGAATTKTVLPVAIVVLVGGILWWRGPADGDGHA